jgi:serine/threonine protein phosphatase PrpC
MTTDICGASHRGNVRSHNEDNIYIDGSYRSDVKMDRL